MNACSVVALFGHWLFGAHRIVRRHIYGKIGFQDVDIANDDRPTGLRAAVMSAGELNLI